MYLQAEKSKDSEGEESEDDDVPEVLDRVDDGRHDGLQAGNDSHRLQSTKHSEGSQRGETIKLNLMYISWMNEMKIDLIVPYLILKR